jgi:hypothetical protein
MVVHSDGRNACRDVPYQLAGDPMTYKIVRFYRDGRNRRTIQKGLTLEQAQAHCEREDTAGEGWFDGYTEDNK